MNFLFRRVHLLNLFFSHLIGTQNFCWHEQLFQTCRHASRYTSDWGRRNQHSRRPFHVRKGGISDKRYALFLLLIHLNAPPYCTTTNGAPAHCDMRISYCDMAPLPVVQDLSYTPLFYDMTCCTSINGASPHRDTRLCDCYTPFEGTLYVGCAEPEMKLLFS